MTKAQQIMAMHKKGKSVRDIALAVYGPLATYREADRKMAYVRVVIRQRRGAGQSATDRRFLFDNGGHKKAWQRIKKRDAASSEFREERLAKRRRQSASRGVGAAI